MAGIISPSMPVWEIVNGTHGNRAYSNLNEGLGKVMRFGGNDAEVLDRLNTEVNRILANKALVDGFAAQSLEAVRMDRPTLDTYLAAEAKKWAAVVQQTGAKVD